MAVALPHPSDRGILLSYITLLHDTPAPHLQVPETERQSVENACDVVLDNLAALRLFFTNTPTGASGSDARAARADEPSAEYAPDPHRSLLPSLTKTSVTYVMTLRDPRNFFESLREELGAAAIALDTSKKTLRALNQSRCCLLTADTRRLKQFVQSANRHGTSESLVMKAGMRDARLDEATTQSPAELLSNTEEPPIATKLLAIPDECVPSDVVKTSYAAFMQGCDAARGWVGDLLKWATYGDDVPKAGTFQVEQSDPAGESNGAHNPEQASTVLEGHVPTAGENIPAQPRSRTVRVKRYEINDAWHVFGPLHDQAQLFFVSDYTTYDARLQCRLLNPDYYVALSGLVDEIDYEIHHMEARAARVPVDYSSLSPYGVFQHNGYSAQRDVHGSDNSATLVFRPPISAFKSLRGLLALYLSFCAFEDDLTSLMYYQRLYTNFLSNAQEVVRAVRELPKPPQAPPAPSPNSSREGGAVDTGVPAHLMTNTFRELQIDHSDRTATTTAEVHSEWNQSAEVRATLISRFESFVELRERVQYLKKGLESDIKRKNRTHCYLPAKAAVAKESTREITQLELDLKALDEHSQRGSTGGFWGMAKASWQALTDVATCKAEIDPYAGLRRLDPTTADVVVPCKNSPLYEEKRLLLAQVQRLWKVVEIQASQLEATYPNLFDRGGKEKLLRRVNELIDKAASRSVVFDSTP